MKYKVYTGPVYVKDVAAAFKQVMEVHNVLDGTEHVYFDFVGDKTQLEVMILMSPASKTLRSFRESVEQVHVPFAPDDEGRWGA